MRARARLLSLTATLGAALVVPAPGHAASLGYLLVAKHSGHCLMPNRSGQVSEVLLQYQCSYVLPWLDQTWYVVETGATFQLVNAWDGRCIETKNGSTTDGTSIMLSPCTGAATQRWTRSGPDTGAYYEIRSAADPVECVDIYHGVTYSGAPAILWTCTGGDHQRFRFLPMPVVP